MRWLGTEGLLSGWGGRVWFLLHDQHVGGDAEGDAFLLEGEDDAAAEFAEDAVALISADAGVDEVDDFAATNVVDAEDFGVGDGDVLKGGVLADVGGQFAEDCHDIVRIGAGVNAYWE